MNISPKNKDALSGNLFIGDNSPDANPLAVLAELDISASVIASAPLSHFRWQLGEQAVTTYTAPRKYSLESLINRLDGLNLDELYAVRTFVSLEADPFQAYSGSVNNDLSHLQAWFPTVRVLERVEQNQLASALCWRIASDSNASSAPSPGDGRDDR